VPDFEKVDDCDLCEAARITPWFHEDDICWIAECEICYVPMVVWRFHGTEPPAEHLQHMHDELGRPGTLTVDHYVTTTCATSPTTITPTRVRRGFFDTGTAADRALIDGGTPLASAGLTASHRALMVVGLSVRTRRSLSVAHGGSTDRDRERIAPLR
jgi:hypothetical protein